MVDRAREGVDSAGDSVDAYAQACTLRDARDAAGWEARLEDIARYNDDAVASTVQLRDWVLRFQRSAGSRIHRPRRPRRLPRRRSRLGRRPMRWRLGY